MSRYFGMILAASLIAAATAPGASAQQPTDPQAQQNVRESEQYERLLCTNAAFRAKRIAQECGALQGSDFYQNCVASFDCKKSPPAVNPKGLPSTEKVR